MYYSPPVLSKFPLGLVFWPSFVLAVGTWPLHCCTSNCIQIVREEQRANWGQGPWLERDLALAVFGWGNCLLVPRAAVKHQTRSSPPSALLSDDRKWTCALDFSTCAVEGLNWAFSGWLISKFDLVPHPIWDLFPPFLFLKREAGRSSEDC